MKALALLSLLVSNYAFALCEIVQDPPTSEIECEVQLARLPTGSEWTLVKQNPYSLGLNSIGGITLDVDTETNGTSALLGKLHAAVPFIDKNTVRAEIDDSSWIDVLLRRSSSGENTIELISYRYIAGVPVTLGTATTSALGNSTNLEYKLSFSYVAGIATLNVLNSSNGVIGSLSQSQFGQVIPIFKVRRGVQPSGTGVVTSGFEQTAYWSE